MRFLLLAVGCVAFVGCTFGAKTCSPTQPCEGGARCDESGFCVASDDSGTGGGGAIGGGGGGATGGGGGGSVGGGAGGGTTGGGTGGGSPACANVTCDTGFECQANTNDAGVCLFSYDSILLTDPSDAGPYGGSQSTIGVSASLQLAANRFGGVRPSSIDVEFKSGLVTSVRTLSWNGTAYAASVDVGALPSGDYVVKAFYDAGLPNIVQSNPLPVRIDNEGPRISISSFDGGAGPFKRDELVLFVVRANEALSQAVLNFDGRAQTETTCPAGTCTPASFCRCFNVDMSEPRLPGMAGEFVLGAVAQDLVMNPTVTMDGGSAQITRLRWMVNLPAILPVRAAPALGADGTLYIGTAGGTLGDRIFALTPAGLTKPAWPPGGVSVGTVQSLAVGEDATLGDVVFYSANAVGGAGVIGALAASDGGVLNAANQCNSTTSTFSGIGLIEANGVVAVGVLSVAGSLPDGGTNLGKPCAVSPVAGISDVNGTSTAFLSSPPVPSPLASASNVTVESSKVTFVGTGGRIISVPFTGTWGTTAVFARVPGALNTTAVSGAALFKQSGNWGAALGGTASLLDLNILNADGGFTSQMAGGVVGVSAVRSVAGPEVAYFYSGVEGASTSVDRFQFNPTGRTPGPTTLAAVNNSPVLGANGHGYAVDSNGWLTVFSTSSFASSSEWAVALPFSVGVLASPNLDCLRNATGAGVTSQVGVLYVASLLGEVAAILVDSPKLDTTADSWPKYQRTASNSGNTAFPLNPGCLP